tara:strand:+ start:141 stop:344 length:204 start_codon:yes stop_codon:yes gene_type:complete
MSSFDFEKFAFRTITIERPSENLRQILKRKGYAFIKMNGGHGDELWINKKYLDIDKVLDIFKDYQGI